jgi:hypothetical protein
MADAVRETEALQRASIGGDRIIPVPGYQTAHDETSYDETVHDETVLAVPPDLSGLPSCRTTWPGCGQFARPR